MGKKNKTTEFTRTPEVPDATPIAEAEAPTETATAVAEPEAPPKAKRVKKAKAPKAEKVVKAAKPKGKKATKAENSVEVEPGTIPDLANAWIGAQVKTMTPATRASYLGDLGVAARHFGEKKKVSAITKKAVLDFFTSDVVMKKRNGKSKSPLSINKTRRAFRMCLEWAAESGLIESAPVPEIESAA